MISAGAFVTVFVYSSRCEVFLFARKLDKIKEAGLWMAMKKTVFRR